MRTLLLLLLSFPAFAAYPNGYDNCKVITVATNSAGMLPGSNNYANFPVLLKFTDADLKGPANSGLYVKSSSGFDIAFYDDQNCSGAGTIMNWEQDPSASGWVSSTGAVIYYVRVSNLTFASDVKFSMYFGNTGISSFQGGATGTAWNSAYTGVFHLGSTSLLSDSTGILTGQSNASSTSSTGIIDGSVLMAGSGQHINLASTAPAALSTITYESIINPTNYTNRGPIVSCSNSSGCQSLAIHESTGVLQWYQTGCCFSATASSHAVPTGSYVYAAGTYASAAGGTYRYINNGCTADGNGTGTLSFSNSGSLTAGWDNAGSDSIQAGIDEIRISNIVRDDNYMIATCKNLTAPATYISEGSRQTYSARAIHKVINGDLN